VNNNSNKKYSNRIFYTPLHQEAVSRWELNINIQRMSLSKDVNVHKETELTVK
jgi:hypothetical protein